jgi:hypothetical protein
VGHRRFPQFIKYDKLIAVREEELEAWNVDFFVEDEGRNPVRVWLDGLPAEVRGKVIARIDLLKKGRPDPRFSLYLADRGQTP